jgi:probable phosphoglycerate mutase
VQADGLVGHGPTVPGRWTGGVDDSGLVASPEKGRDEAGTILLVTSAPLATSADPAATEVVTVPEDAAPEPANPPRPTTLVLVRHAVTPQTGPILSGRTPGIDLSDLGHEQAAGAGERLKDLPVRAVYASPIDRTQQTAAHIAAHHDLAVRVLDGVIEADYGDWTGGQLTDLAKTDLWKTVQRSPSRARFPNGESIAEMQVRTVAALEAVVARHPGETIVVVSHADPIKAVIAHFTGVHLDLFQRIAVSPASITVFVLGPHGVTLVKCNDTGSLAELVPPPEATARDAAPNGSVGAGGDTESAETPRG